MRTAPTMDIDRQAMLRLFCLVSPAFPVGSFAYSHGLEGAVEAGDVADEAGVRGWLEGVLRHGSGRSDAILLRHAHRAAGDPASLRAIALVAEAACLGRERHEETMAQGAAFASAASVWERVESAPYPVAFGALASRQGIDEACACLGYLFSWVSNLVSASLRLGLMGQAAGLRVLTALEPALMEVADETREASLDDIGGACFLADVSAMRHETQYSRVFRS
jgi:urease accessory protein